MTLEVCIASLDDALAAQAGGADRLELNSGLDLGGLTPSLGLLLEVLEAVSLPVVAMLRPRPGGFAYSAAELRVMERDAELLLEHGAAGLTVGILLPDGCVDVRRCRQLIARCGPAEIVFHRAFDFTPDPSTALEQLIDLGIRRVMTSGQEQSALQGAGLIARLVEQAAGRIEILPAGGIRRHTVHELVTRTGCTQVHASLRGPCQDSSTEHRPDLLLRHPAPPSESCHDRTDAAAVAELIRVLEDTGT